MYSKDWEQKAFTIASTNNFDILINKEGFYLIKIPSSSTRSADALFGGAGASFTRGLDERVNRSFRSAWLDKDDNVTSNSFQGHVHTFVPRDLVKERVVIEKHLFDSILVVNGEKKIKLKNNKKEINALQEQLANI
ncbi:MAG TPA: hypothetical protein VJA27_00055 [Patescibacteria group bacterium]|nr:hypothetical protein [Patescibacteria group bacterium]